MPGRLVHFEFPVHDASRATQFWQSLFGWTFERLEGPMEYHMVEGGEPTGAVYPSQNAGRGPNVYFDVDDIQQAAARVRELGGEAEEPGAIPGIGWYAFCRDTEGNLFCLYQPDESVEPQGQS